jgi:hypothetical protein
MEEYQVGDIVVIETENYGPYQGYVSALDDDGSIVVQHNLKLYPEHPSGATYVDVQHLSEDVTLLVRAIQPRA